MKYVITEELNQAVNMNNMTIKFNSKDSLELCTFTATYNGDSNPDIKGTRRTTAFKNEFVIAEFRISYNARNDFRKKIANRVFNTFMEAFTLMIESHTINTMKVRVEKRDTAIYMSDKLVIEIGQREFTYEPLRFGSIRKRPVYGYNNNYNNFNKYDR